MIMCAMVKSYTCSIWTKSSLGKRLSRSAKERLARFPIGDTKIIWLSLWESSMTKI